MLYISEHNLQKKKPARSKFIHDTIDDLSKIRVKNYIRSSGDADSHVMVFRVVGKKKEEKLRNFFFFIIVRELYIKRKKIVWELKGNYCFTVFFEI